MNSDENNYMEMEGAVEAISRDKFIVIVDNTEMKVIATISGKLRMNGIKLLVGDRVKILVSAHDPSKGRIIYRMK